jgi:RNA 2',3'-cyclic 3'-phosphodiesterase
MRLFIAVHLQETIRAAVQNEVRQVEPSLEEHRDAIRWTPTEQLHVTLKFLGNAREDQLPLLGAALDSVCAGRRNFSLSFDTLGVFPPKGPPSIVWMGVKEGAETLSSAAAGIEAACEALGFAKEARAFHPHLTIGRVKTVRYGNLLRERLAAHPPFTIGPMTVESIDLVESLLSAAGPKYRIRYRGTLQPAL